MNLRNTFNLGVKELRGLWRDPVMLVLIVYSFSLSVWTSSNAEPEALTNAAISIVDEDQSHLSTRISSAFYPPYFVEPQMITTAEMDHRMDQGLDTFALNIPPDFARDVLAGKSPAIQLNIDATRMSQAFTGGGYIQQIVSAEVSEYVAGHRAETVLPVDLALRARYNPSLDPKWFGAISSVIQSITMLSLILTGAALIREKEHGTVEHLLVMPVTATEIMFSKIWSMGLVVLLALGVLEIPLDLVVVGLLLLFVILGPLRVDGLERRNGGFVSGRIVNDHRGGRRRCVGDVLAAGFAGGDLDHNANRHDRSEHRHWHYPGRTPAGFGRGGFAL